MPDLQALLDQIDRLDQEASEAPWQQDRNEHPTGDVYVEAGSERMHRKMERIDPDIGCGYAVDAEFIALARTALPAMSKALRAVLEIHQKTEHQRAYGFPRADKWEHYCTEDNQSWPCATVQAITDAMETDDG